MDEYWNSLGVANEQLFDEREDACRVPGMKRTSISSFSTRSAVALSPRSAQFLISKCSLVSFALLASVDSPDKYINSGSVLNQTVGGSLIWGNGEWTRLIFTAHTHWKFTYCTTLTIAAKMSTLVSDTPIFNGISDFDRFPLLKKLWISLQKAGRTLISSVPGGATMSYAAYISPVVDWPQIISTSS